VEKPRARLLAVVADVDADLALAGHHAPYGCVHLALELARVDRLAAVLLTSRSRSAACGECSPRASSGSVRHSCA
jgi:hypothetical protein